MQDIVLEPRVAFQIDPSHPKRLLICGPSQEKNSQRFAMGFAAVRLQKRKNVVFTTSIDKSAIAKATVLNLRTCENQASAEAIVKALLPEVVLIEDCHLIPNLEGFLDFLDTLNLTAILSGMITQDTGRLWPTIAEIFHTCRLHPMFDECETCRGKEGFFRRTVLTKSLSASSDSTFPTVVTECATCYQKGYQGLLWLEKLDPTSPTEFAQGAMNLLNGVIATHSGDYSGSDMDSELDDDFGDLSVYEKQRLGFDK